ncbi:MAG: DUF928 domain-containing protein [Cyanobacteria bacterium P01_C01_bin.118]
MKCIYLATFISLMVVLGFGESSQSLGRTSSVDASASTAGRPSMGHPRQGTRRGGGSRGGVCDLPTDVPALTALMPDTSIWDSTAIDVVFSFTTTDTPNLWFYLPYSLDTGSRVTFTLKDADDETLKRAQLDTTQPLPAGPSMVRVSLAELGQTLAPAADYHWYLTVNCESGPTVSVDGWLNYQPGNQPDPYDQQFLVDTLSVLAEAQLSNPGDNGAQSAWREMLESADLGDITDAPLTDCCDFVEQF